MAWMDGLRKEYLMAVPQILAIHFEMEVALLDDDSHIRIAVWLDDENDECAKDAAVSCVCGPDSDGMWHKEWLTDFDDAYTN